MSSRSSPSCRRSAWKTARPTLVFPAPGTEKLAPWRSESSFGDVAALERSEVADPLLPEELRQLRPRRRLAARPERPAERTRPARPAASRPLGPVGARPRRRRPLPVCGQALSDARWVRRSSISISTTPDERWVLVRKLTASRRRSSSRPGRAVSLALVTSAARPMVRLGALLASL